MKNLGMFRIDKVKRRFHNFLLYVRPSRHPVVVRTAVGTRHISFSDHGRERMIPLQLCFPLQRGTEVLMHQSLLEIVPVGILAEIHRVVGILFRFQLQHIRRRDLQRTEQSGEQLHIGCRLVFVSRQRSPGHLRGRIQTLPLGETGAVPDRLIQIIRRSRYSLVQHAPIESAEQTVRLARPPEQDIVAEHPLLYGCHRVHQQLRILIRLSGQTAESDVIRPDTSQSDGTDQCLKPIHRIPCTVHAHRRNLCQHLPAVSICNPFHIQKYHHIAPPSVSSPHVVCVWIVLILHHTLSQSTDLFLCFYHTQSRAPDFPASWGICPHPPAPCLIRHTACVFCTIEEV